MPEPEPIEVGPALPPIEMEPVAVVQEHVAPEPAQDDAGRMERKPLNLDPLPLDKPLPEGDNTWLTKYQIFKAVSQKLARVGDWKKLAAITGHALLSAPYATRMTRTAMLLDLARIYRDRLGDEIRAEQAFAVLTKEDPSSSEAIDYLVEVYQKRGEWGSIYDLYLFAVEASWDPNERLAWTQQAAALAQDELNNSSLAIKAWEHLWNLGDALEEASRELTCLYRRAGRWSEMAKFLQQQADRFEGSAKLVILRELAEVKLMGMKDPDGASVVLEQIVQLSPQDPIATLQLARVYAQREDWMSLQELGQRAASEEEAPESSLDLQNLVADSLWRAGRHQQAVEAYDRILQVEPGNYDGNRRKQEFLTQAGQYAELLDLIVAEADSTEEEKEKAKLLAQAAVLADEKLDDPRQAIDLWESQISFDSEHLPAFEALTRLYESVEDLRGVARAFEGQLSLTKEPGQRIALLRELGQHYARRLNEDDRAEACWKEILALDPSDLPAREELTELHRRRGDFESLNSALMRQIWLTHDDVRAENLCRRAAENLDENFEDPARSAEAWHRVLDFSPMDLPALTALKSHYTRLEQRRKLIATLEREIRATQEVQVKIERTLQVARLWEEENDLKGAAECYERILRWEPVNEEALDGLVAIYQKEDQQGKAAGALEHASVLLQDTGQRIGLLRRSFELLPTDDHFARFFHLRRILFLSWEKRRVLEELKAEAEAASKKQAEILWPELAAILTQLACQETSPTARLDLHRELAWVCEKKLSSKVRAYLALQGVLFSPENHDQVLEDVTKLAQSTKRYEDLLALLDRLSTQEFELAQRKDIIRQRAAICENEIGNPARAFHELRRLLELNPEDRTPLEELQRLADENDLWPQFDAILTELWDRSESDDDRMELLTRRAQVAKDKLSSASQAFDIMVRQFRFAAEDAELLGQLTKDAEDLKAWDWLLPMLEASQLASTEDTAAKELALTAALFEQKLQDKQRALTLYTLAFTTNPAAGDLADKLEELAAETDQFDSLANTFREAASVHGDPDRSIDLLRRTSRIYEDKLVEPAKAFDVHRRLLHLKEDEMRSLEIVIDAHRKSEEWRDLRDRLEQWIRLAPEDQDRIPKLLEIATISEQNLSDPEMALETYGKILEIDPEHEVAREGLKGLVVAIAEPGMRIRWLRMELKNADEARAIEIHLEIAQILEEEKEDFNGAIETLQQLADSTGPAGPSFEPLKRLLQHTKQWKELVLLLKAAGEAQEKDKDKIEALDEAISFYHEYLDGSEKALAEELYRSLLRLRPADLSIRVRLARLLREAERFYEVSQLLTENLEHLTTQLDRITTLYELAQLQSQNLDQLEEAETSWRKILEEKPDEEGAILGLAWSAIQKENLEAYLEFRQQQAKVLPSQEGALVLCHLAEICDENESLKDKMIPFYREARRVDPQNVPAMEALKGIGRRLKNLRPAAALLPLEGERDLEVEARAERMRALGDGSLESTPKQALDWYHRAVATDPNNRGHWEALAAALQQTGDLSGSYRARLGWMHSLARNTQVHADLLPELAERVYQVATVAQSAGDSDAYTHWIHYAYDLVPNHAPSALATAQAMIEQENIEGAHALLHSILKLYVEGLDEQQRIRAHYSRGLTLRRLDRLDEAIEDFRQALHLDPLHADALIAMGEIQAETKRFAAALEHLVRALTVVEDMGVRSQLYYRLGVLWEDGLTSTAEAGACYELALAGGITERDLLHRVLLHLQRTGRLDQSLEVVDNLLPTAHDTEELATLWQVRGEIFAAREGQEEQAIEAFDMALSYDPGRQEAREGLTLVLERRGDWNQLLQVLEATCDVAPPAQQSQALRRMADICNLQLNDTHRAETYLRQSVNIFPTREALEYLERIYTVESGRIEERKEIVGLLVEFGPPWFERCMELAQMLLDDDKIWSWCLMSPLLGVSQIDPNVKATVQAMRKEYERPAVICPSPDHEAMLVHPSVKDNLTIVLAELGELVRPLGICAIEEAGDGGAIAISENTNMGKIFSATAENLGLLGATLHRTQALPESLQVINSDPHPSVVVRTEVIQQLVHAEVGFFFAYALELAKPGYRVMAAMPVEERDLLLPAIWHALDFSVATAPGAKKLAEYIVESTEDKIRSDWADALGELRNEDPLELGRKWWQGVGFTARRAGLVAGADLRQVFRVMSRLEDAVPRPRVVARLDELDEYVANSEHLQDLVAFSASPKFGQILRDGLRVME